MRAVNLMPGDGRAERQASAASTTGAVYVLLAGLGVLVVFVSLWTVTNHQIDSNTATLDKANAEAQAAEQRAAASAPYEQFAQLARNRVATVTSLSATRFDWAHGLREVARVVPDDVWLVSINGTSGASGAAPGPTTSAAPAPSFELEGCTTSQAKVARLMARVRAVDGVRTVQLRKSAKPEASGSDQCPANKASDPMFTIVIGFAVPGDTKAAVDSTGQIDTSAPAPSSGAASPPASSGDAGANTTNATEVQAG